MDWAPLLVASVPAAAAIVAAVIAASSARRVRQREEEAQRLRDLEARIAQKKHDTYQPMIDFLSQALDPANQKALAAKGSKLREQFTKFDAWIAIYGSDEAVRAWHNLRQGTYLDAPSSVLLRLYADFVMAARHDMGYPDSIVTTVELLGIRISDIYTTDTAGVQDALTLDWPGIQQRFEWQAPWLTTGRRSEPQ
jgi:hypothetical protein